MLALSVLLLNFTSRDWVNVAVWSAVLTVNLFLGYRAVRFHIIVRRVDGYHRRMHELKRTGMVQERRAEYRQLLKRSNEAIRELKAFR